MASLVQFILWLMVFAGILAGCYLFYEVNLRIEHSKYERPQ